MSEAVENQNRETEKTKAEPCEKPEKKHAQAHIVGNLQIKNPNSVPVKTRGRATKQDEDDEYWPLSGKPYFHLIISKTHIKPLYQLFIPVRLHQVLPCVDIPVVLGYHGKTWNLMYLGDRTRKRFDQSWKDFAVDNDLKVGDGCVFELAECSRTKLIFKVQILRGDFPAELLFKAKGQTRDAPITID